MKQVDVEHSAKGLGHSLRIDEQNLNDKGSLRAKLGGTPKAG